MIAVISLVILSGVEVHYASTPLSMTKAMLSMPKECQVWQNGAPKLRIAKI